MSWTLKWSFHDSPALLYGSLCSPRAAFAALSFGVDRAVAPLFLGPVK